MDEAKAKRIVSALMWLPLEADCDDGLEDILNDEQRKTLADRLVAALLDPGVYDIPVGAYR